MYREQRVYGKRYLNGNLLTDKISLYVVNGESFFYEKEAEEYMSFLKNENCDISHIKNKPGNNFEVYGTWYYVEYETDMELLKRFYKKHKHCYNTRDLVFEKAEWVFINVNEGDTNTIYITRYNDLFYEVKDMYNSLLDLDGSINEKTV